MTMTAEATSSRNIDARTHWLVQAASRAKLPGATDLQLPPGITIANAWDAVARATGVATKDLAARVAPALGLPCADFRSAHAHALRLIPERIARRLKVFPVSEDEQTIVVAVADPANVETEQAVAFASGRRAIFALASPLAIEEALDAAYTPDRSVERLLSSVDDEFADIKVLEEIRPETVAEQEVQTAPVVKLTNLILRDAVKSGASDVHIEPGSTAGSVRFRIDGVMRLQMRLPSAALNRVVSRIKVLSKLDISDRLRPQDGRARIEVESRTYDLRVSTVPTREAEKAVIRILRPDTTKGLEDCGLAPHELARMRQLLSHRDGIVIVTGPTGSGKTTTLYSAIKELASGETNIMTVEDPVEYELPGITQMQVEPKRNVTFASALRAILRQDPDIIFVGEIRDAETAHVAAQAALTGHLVLATLHTNDAMSAVARLLDLGLDNATIATCLRGTVAQRLVRRVCPECASAVTGELTEQEARLSQSFGVRPVVRPVGCNSCGNTGYRGRVPVNEVAIITPAIAELISKGASSQALQKAARDAGMRSLREVAVERASAGVTTLQEVERVLGDTGVVASPAPTPAADGPAKPRVLVVDDDEVIRRVVLATLEAGGYSGEGVDDGDVALQRLASDQEWALVITDLHMTRVGGEELLRSVRESVATSALPVIVLTGSSEKDSELAVMEAGADDYLRKPLDPPRLLARVKAVLRRAAT
jgi:type II secretory ATPase GspE/PulE/Tfp pilus assembly ATPase PilB-like protein/ActR/RegA family two-component response regulator